MTELVGELHLVAVARFHSLAAGGGVDRPHAKGQSLLHRQVGRAKIPLDQHIVALRSGLAQPLKKRGKKWRKPFRIWRQLPPDRKQVCRRCNEIVHAEGGFRVFPLRGCQTVIEDDEHLGPDQERIPLMW